MLAPLQACLLALASLGPQDVFSDRALNEPSQEVIEAFPECETDESASDNEMVMLCPLKVFGSKAEVSFLFDGTLKVKAVAVSFAKQSKLPDAMKLATPALAALGKNYKVEKSLERAEEKKWRFHKPGYSHGEVQLHRNSNGSWRLMCMIFRDDA